MITLNASGSSVTFTFNGNSTYLNDGTIEVPKNSLALIIDESDMVTFKKSQSSDIFVSANIAEFGMTKDELESWYKENMVGSTGGVDSGTVQTMIDESISGKADSSAVTEEISAAVSGKADTSYVDSAVSGKTDTTTYSAYTAATDSRLAEDEEVTAAALVNLNEALSGKLDTSIFESYSGSVDTALSNKQDTSGMTAYTQNTSFTAYTAATDTALSNKLDVSAVTSAVTSGSTDVLTSGGAYEQFGGLKLVKLTESEYAALVTKDPNVLYVVIPDPSNP